MKIISGHTALVIVRSKGATAHKIHKTVSITKKEVNTYLLLLLFSYFNYCCYKWFSKSSVAYYAKLSIIDGLTLHPNLPLPNQKIIFLSCKNTFLTFIQSDLLIFFICTLTDKENIFLQCHFLRSANPTQTFI